MNNLRLKPLQGWETSVKNGHIKRVTDSDIQSAAIEIIGANVANNYIAHPHDNNTSLGIKMPTIVMQIKSVNINFITLVKKIFYFWSNYNWW